MDNFQFAQVLGMHVEALSVTAEIEGMKALNQWREMRGESQAYGEEAFVEKANILSMISEQMRTVSRG